MFKNSLILGVLAVLASPAMAADLPKASVSGSIELLAANCANCHGTDGKGEHAIPGLAGLPRDLIAASLKGYRDGSQDATIMHQLAKGYTDSELEALADYFSKQRR